MGYSSLKYVCEQIDDLGLFKCRAVGAEGQTIGYTEQKDTEAMVDWVKSLVAENDGRITLHLESMPGKRATGSRSKQPNIEKVELTVRGTRGSVSALPPREEGKPSKPGDPPAPPVNLTYDEAMRVARMEVQLEYLQKEREELLAELEDDDDDDDDDQRMPAAPIHNPLSTLFGMSGDQTHQVLTGFASLLGKKNGAEQPIAGAPAQDPKEAELIRAFKRWGAADPTKAMGFAQDILDNFGDNPKPVKEDADKAGSKKKDRERT